MDSTRSTSHAARVESDKSHETKQIGRKKSVSFAPRTKGYIIPNIQSMSRRTKEILWQTPADKKTDENDMVKTVRAIRKGQQVAFDDPDLCARGIEHLIDYAALLRKSNQREAMLDAVLGTQELHWRLGYRQADPEDIRDASVRCSKIDAQRAVRIANQDAVEARKIHKLSLKKQVQEARLRRYTTYSNTVKEDTAHRYVRVVN